MLSLVYEAVIIKTNTARFTTAVMISSLRRKNELAARSRAMT